MDSDVPTTSHERHNKLQGNNVPTTEIFKVGSFVRYKKQLTRSKLTRWIPCMMNRVWLRETFLLQSIQSCMIGCDSIVVWFSSLSGCKLRIVSRFFFFAYSGGQESHQVLTERSTMPADLVSFDSNPTSRSGLWSVD